MTLGQLVLRTLLVASVTVTGRDDVALASQDTAETGRPPASKAGNFHWPHAVVADAQGNLYTGEVDGAARVQRLLRYGETGCSGEGSVQVGKYKN